MNAVQRAVEEYDCYFLFLVGEGHQIKKFLGRYFSLRQAVSQSVKSLTDTNRFHDSFNRYSSDSIRTTLPIHLLTLHESIATSDIYTDDSRKSNINLCSRESGFLRSARHVKA